MKTLFFIGFFFLSLITIAQPVNQKDSKGKKQGVWQKQYPKLQSFEYKGQFKDDIPVGTFTYYYPSSKVKGVVVHGAGGRSQATLYHENGVLFAKGIYRNQLKDSVWDYFGPSGKQSLKETYLKDKLHGKTTIYYVPEDITDKSLMPAVVTNYSNGVKEGEEIEYFDFGTVKGKVTYVNGLKEGIQTINHPNGKKMILDRFKKGQKHGWCGSYDQSGVETGKKYFYYGKELQGKELDEKLRQMKILGINPNG